ncbi:MAG: penicillin-binding protein [Clostridium sp.]|nr:penicillin-binding protein [Clostridium sp.]
MIVNKPKKKKTISRYAVLYMIMAVIFGMILCKLLYLQVYKYDDYKEKADTSSTKFISESAPRGIIYDSDGNILATSQQTYVLTYMQTTESANAIFSTLDKVFKVLSDNGENFEDDLLLKVNSDGQFYFAFKSDDSDVKEATELLFKSDRGLRDEVIEKLYKNHDGDFTDEELDKINAQLLEISPEDTFYYLVELYAMYKMLLPEDYTTEEYDAIMAKYKGVDGKTITKDLLEKYSLEDIRKYMVVKDAINLQSYQGYKSVTIASDITKDTAFVFYQMLNELPGIDVDLEPVRYYPYNSLASSILGYVSSITSTEEEIYELKGYDVSTDLVGAAGVEAAFEEQLKGKDGGTTVKVNSEGRTTEELFKLESYAGNNIHLTIDKDVQYAAEQALKDTLARVDANVTNIDYGNGSSNATRGSVVAIEVGTGRVLAMASYPTYNPNDFATGQLSNELYKQYFSPDYEAFAINHIAKTGATAKLDELFPLNEHGLREDTYDLYPKAMFNYSTQALLPPGSVFKPLTAIAGLMDGVISTGTTVNDIGVWQVGNLTQYNFQKRGNGIISVREALMHSSNFFFHNVGYELYLNNGGNSNDEETRVAALDSIAHYAYKFGLGVAEGGNASTGIEIEENFGQTYNFKSWKNRIIDTPMYTLVESLQSGSYNGSFYYAPLNISKNATDTEILANAKAELKEQINKALELVGTNAQLTNADDFASKLIGYIKSIMEISDEYKASLENYNSSRSNKTNIDEQADIIANAIAQYTISDMSTQIDTYAEIVKDAIGQSMNAFTPLQLANYVATLASGGTRYKVMLVDQITTPDGELVEKFEPEVVDKLDIPGEYLQAVKEGMRMVNTYSGNGTAYNSFNSFPVVVSGKTGTADLGSEENYTVTGRRPYGNYISFAPAENPQIAIFSTLYDGNKGSEGATIHLAIYEAFFKELLENNHSDYTKRSESYQKYVANGLEDNKENADNSDNDKSEEENNNSEENTTTENTQ